MPENQPGKGIGHFLGAMRIDAFRKKEEFKKNMDQWIQRFRAATPIDDNLKVLIPGDPEREMEQIRRKMGIPLLAVVWEDIGSVADKLNIKI
jgi:LDH2 family malate/lactate/ureidoglycolate dehydrogenase